MKPVGALRCKRCKHVDNAHQDGVCYQMVDLESGGIVWAKRCYCDKYRKPVIRSLYRWIRSRNEH